MRLREIDRYPLFRGTLHRTVSSSRKLHNNNNDLFDLYRTQPTILSHYGKCFKKSLTILFNN